MYYSEEEIRKMVSEAYDPLVLETYSEMDQDDSILLIARRQ
jgi:hypothetical protein